MIDISTLSKTEILELEKQIQDYKKSEKNHTFYKVTFHVRFNPEKHENSDICDVYSFSDWLSEEIFDVISASFGLNYPESVSEFSVEQVNETDAERWF